MWLNRKLKFEIEACSVLIYVQGVAFRFYNIEYNIVILYEYDIKKINWKIIKYDKNTIQKIIWIWHKYTNISKIVLIKKNMSKFI